MLDIDTVVNFKDPNSIKHLASRSGVFTQMEIEIAGELAQSVLDGSDTSYQFIFYRDKGDNVIAYSCFGEIPLTDRRYDLYWIMVDPSFQRQGIAATLLAETEASIYKAGGLHLYAETSGLSTYNVARSFYQKHGFVEVARLLNFYRDGDDKIIFSKKIICT